MARRATAIAQLREQAEGPVLVLDSGDSLFGIPLSDRTDGALPIEAMNAIGYDAMALGATDLGTDADSLAASLQLAEFDILSANMGPADILPGVQPYTLRQIEGHTIAVIGATAGSARERSGTLGVTVEMENALDAVRRTAEELRGQADILIVLSNLNEAANLAIAEQVPGIDAVIGARSGALPAALTRVDGPDGQVVIQGSGSRGQVMGALTLQFDSNGRVVRYEGRTVYLSSGYEDDPTILDLLREYGALP